MITWLHGVVITWEVKSWLCAFRCHCSIVVFLSLPTQEISHTEYVRPDMDIYQDYIEGCLTFKNPTHHNNGMYTLEATNYLGVATNKVYGHFLDKPFNGELKQHMMQIMMRERWILVNVIIVNPVLHYLNVRRKFVFAVNCSSYKLGEITCRSWSKFKWGNDLGL